MAVYNFNHVRKTKIVNLCIPVGNRIISKQKMFRPHLSLFQIKTSDFTKVNQIKKDALIFIKENIVPDETGSYLIRYDSITRTGKTKIELDGPIITLQRDLVAYLNSKYLGDLVDFQPAIVDLSGHKKAKLYPAFDLMQLSLECE